MPFAREPVRMSGTLKGRNQSAECMVSATRVTLLGTPHHKDCNLTIEWVSKRLPEGDYRLLVEGQSLNMLHSNERWQTKSGAAK